MGAARPQAGGRCRQGGFGALRLTAVLLAGVALFAGPGAAYAQTDQTLWSADMIADTLTEVGTGYVANYWGYSTFGTDTLGSISGSADFSYEGTQYTAVAAFLIDIDIGPGSITVRQARFYASPALPASPADSLILDLDGTEYRFATASVTDSIYSWSTTQSRWSPGDTVAVKVIARAAGTPVEPPAVASVDVADAPSDKTYAIGDTIDLAVTFSEDVTLDVTNGTPQLELTVGDATETATCGVAAGTQLICLYPVAENDAGAIAVAADKLTLNGGTLTGPNGLSADTTYTADEVSIDADLRVDGVRPTLVTSGDDAPKVSADGATVVLTFTETLSATTAPASAFAVAVAGSTRTVNSVSASGTVVTLALASAVASGETVTVAYTDPSGNDDGNAVQDAAGNDAATFPRADGDEQHRVLGCEPERADPERGDADAHLPRGLDDLHGHRRELGGLYDGVGHGHS